MAPCSTRESASVAADRELEALLDLVRRGATKGETAVLRHTLVRILEVRSDRARLREEAEPRWAA